jgi:FkbM family methyltransferase
MTQLNPIYIDHALVAYSYLPNHPGKSKIYERLLPYVSSTWDAPRLRERFGVKFECDLRDKVSRYIYYTGFDRRNCLVLKRLIKPGNTVFDIGANIGYFGLLFAKWMRGAGTVHAFEPFPQTARRFERNLDLNPELRAMVRLNRIALSDFAGTIAMSVPDEGHSGCNHLNADGSEMNNVMTLDAYVQREELTRIDFIKIDVEGSEVALLQGAEVTLSRFHPVLMIEVNPTALRRFGKTATELIGALTRLGYKMSYATRTGKLKRLKRLPVFGEEPDIFAFPG